MAILPIFEIFFALALALSPANCKRFTVTTDELREPVTWTLKSDGWHAASSSQADLGVFTIEGKTVTIKREGNTTSESVDGAFSVKPGKEAPEVQIEGEAASFTRQGNKIILGSMENRELPPIVIEFQP